VVEEWVIEEGEPLPAARDRETILLAEDEAVVRRIALRTLRMLGYTVLEAMHGRDALELANSYEGPIHLLITDDVMPHLGGRALASELRRRRPGVRVLFTSGYPEDRWAAPGAAGRDGYLGKPYDPSALARRVRDMLDDSD
jgi:two-component system, cell cycle sensor histidine kinase and response regulator CckA